MIKNYLKIALRNILKNPGYAAVNIFGLTIGITCFTLIFLVVRYELGFDRFHKDSEKIFRIDNELRLSSGNYKYPTCASGIAPALVREVPEAVGYTRLNRSVQSTIIAVDTELHKEERMFFADSNFLQFFSFDILYGSVVSALSAPDHAVLTERLALKYFGEANAVGRIFTLKGQPDMEFQVKAVLKNLPAHSHIQFDVLLSNEALRTLNDGSFLDNWNNDGFYSYIKLSDPGSASLIEQRLLALKEKYVEEDSKILVNPDLIPLHQIHLHSNLRNEIVPNGNIDFVYIFSAIAVFILLIASINYMNLATARSARRAQEVGIRKVLGAHKGQLIRQFLGESLVLTLIAALISLIIINAFLPQFSQFTGKELSPAMLLDLRLVGVLLLVILLIGFGSGSYPALFLSSFRPVIVLKGKLVPGMHSSAGLRKGLVVFQFTISIVLIIGTYAVFNQLTFMKNKPLGFDKENMLVISNTNNAITPQLNTFKNQLLTHTSIEGVAASFSKPGGLRPIIFIKSETVIDDQNNLNLAGINVDFDYLRTMNIEVIQGRDFDRTIPTDSTEAIIINKKAAEELNISDDPVGRLIQINLGGDWINKRVIGMIDNINFEPLQRKTEACFYGPIFGAYLYLYVKVRPGSISETLAFIESEWNRFAPEQPFEYSFLSQDLDQLYQSEEKLSEIIIYFAMLAILIACLGLFGLASFSTEQRVKEIGVRKVLGASVTRILLLLSKDFAWLIVIAFVIATPAAYYLVNWWLQNFAFKVSIGISTFIFAGIGAFLIAMLTVSYKTISAAGANPVKALRFE